MVFWVFRPCNVMSFSVVYEECEDGSSISLQHVETKPTLLHGVYNIWVEEYITYVNKLF
jgi:hypothetical protein